jgi:hypothetical protein
MEDDKQQLNTRARVDFFRQFLIFKNEFVRNFDAFLNGTIFNNCGLKTKIFMQWEVKWRHFGRKIYYFEIFISRLGFFDPSYNISKLPKSCKQELKSWQFFKYLPMIFN